MTTGVTLNNYLLYNVYFEGNLVKQGRTGPRSPARFKPEFHPRSKITKCPEEQQEQEQLKQLPSPWAIGRSQKLKLRNIFQTGTTTRSRRRRRGCGRSKFHGIGSNVRQGHKKSDWFKKFFNIKRMTTKTTTTVLL